MENSKLYELMLIFAPDKTEAQHTDLFNLVKKHIMELGGTVTLEDVWGLRDFAYRINKHNEGFYVVLHMEFDGDKLRELEEFLRLEKDVLRHLITIPPSDYEYISYNELAAEEERVKKEKGDIVTKKKPEAKAPSKVVKTPSTSTEEKVEPKAEVQKDSKELSEEIDEKLSKIIDEEI